MPVENSHLETGVSEKKVRQSNKSAVAKPTEKINVAQFRLRQLEFFQQKKEEQRADETRRRASLPSRRDVIQHFEKSNWVPIGPSAVRKGQVEGGSLVSGRIKGFAVAQGGQRVFAATANGGVWQSLDGGENWRSLMDDFDQLPSETALLNVVPNAIAFDNNGVDSLACGAIELWDGPTASQDHLFIGTGEGPGNIDKYFGIGPVVSLDGGQTWQRETVVGAADELVGQGFFQLAKDLFDSTRNRVLAATTNGIYRRKDDRTWGKTQPWNHAWSQSCNQHCE